MSKTFWIKFKDVLMDQLRGQAIKLALKKFLGTAVGGGFKAWLIKLIITEFMDEIGEPLLRAGLNRIGYAYDRVKGKVLIKKLSEATDETDYDSTIDDILN